MKAIATEAANRERSNTRALDMTEVFLSGFIPIITEKTFFDYKVILGFL